MGYSLIGANTDESISVSIFAFLSHLSPPTVKKRSRTKYSRQFKPHFIQRYLEQLTALSVYFCQVFMMVAFVRSPESIFFPPTASFFNKCSVNFCSVNRWPAESLISMVRELWNNTNSTLLLSARTHQQHWMYFQWDTSQTGRKLSPTPVL